MRQRCSKCCSYQAGVRSTVVAGLLRISVKVFQVLRAKRARAKVFNCGWTSAGTRHAKRAWGAPEDDGEDDDDDDGDDDGDAGDAGDTGDTGGSG